MSNLLRNIISSEAVPTYFQKYLGKPDSRVTKLPLLNSPFYIIGVWSVYATVLLVGCKMMKDRPPLNLRKILVAYNCFQVVLSTYICKEIFVCAYLLGYRLSCATIEQTNVDSLRMVRAFWLFYVSKVIDLFDTVFLVLRKNRRQITFLHVYHHCSMIFNWYIGFLYSPGGQAFFSAGVNSMVHIVMYTYYLLASMGPTMKKHLWWKKYLTQLQMIQFIIVIIHLIWGSINSCNQPPWLGYFTITYLWTLVALFSNFYYRSYKRPSITKYYKAVDEKAGGDTKKE